MLVPALAGGVDVMGSRWATQGEARPLEVSYSVFKILGFRG
jgi:hypothetical protein